MNANTTELLERPIKGVLTEAAKRWVARLAGGDTAARRLRTVGLMTDLSDADLDRLDLKRREAAPTGDARD